MGIAFECYRMTGLYNYQEGYHSVPLIFAFGRLLGIRPRCRCCLVELKYEKCRCEFVQPPKH